MAARPFANPKTAPEEAEAIEAAVGATSALPTDFFDNPQMDPANKGKAKALASTRKEQTLRDEMEEFQRAVRLLGAPLPLARIPAHSMLRLRRAAG